MDKDDFLTNYIQNGNLPIDPTTLAGVTAQAPAKGLGGFAPDPRNNPYEPSVDEVVSLYVDGEGSLVTRGSILTDESSFRDDFTSTLVSNLTGTVSFTNGSNIVTGSGTAFSSELNRDDYVRYTSDNHTHWVQVLRVNNDESILIHIPYEGSTATGVGVKTNWVEIKSGSGSTSNVSSKINLTINSTSGDYVYVKRFADYAPMIQFWRLSLQNRLANQNVFFGFRDDINSPQMFCDVFLSGTDNTKIKFRSAWKSDIEETEVKLPSGLTTSSFLKYKIDVSPDYCALLINNMLVAKHDIHIPGMYNEMEAVCGIENTGTASGSNTLALDSFFIANQNQIQITNTFTNPIATITREDQHTICGKLTTTLTSSNQVVLEYLVPDNKIFCIIGYYISCSGTAGSSPVKICTNVSASEPAAPGTVDGQIFRTFNLDANSSTGDVDFSIPRKIASGGDTVYVTVTPTSVLSTVWRANIDFVLR